MPGRRRPHRGVCPAQARHHPLRCASAPLVAVTSPSVGGVALMTAVPTPGPDAAGPRVSPVIAMPPRGRRRRPSGEPPPLPRHIDHTTRWYLVLAGLAVALWVGLTTPAFLGIITRADLTVLRAVATLRSDPLTRVMLNIDAVRSLWTVRVLVLGTIAALIALRR